MFIHCSKSNRYTRQVNHSTQQQAFLLAFCHYEEQKASNDRQLEVYGQGPTHHETLNIKIINGFNCSIKQNFGFSFTQ